MTTQTKEPSLTRSKFSLPANEMTLLALAVAGFVGLAIASGGSLLSGSSLQTLFTYLAVPVLIGLAQLVALSVGQMNLSVGALGGFVAVAAGIAMAHAGVPAWIAVLGALVLGAAVGAINGVLVVLTRINGFIVTLATMTILAGLQYQLVGTETVANYSPGLRSLGTAAVFHIPVIFIVSLVVAGLLALFMRRAIWGRRLLASGGNPLAARLSGISNDRSVVLAHCLSGLLIGVAAVVTLMSSPGVNQSIGGDWLLSSFAAPIIGGVALSGGAVSVSGTVLAALIVRLVDVARAQFSLNPSWVNFVVGAVVLGTVVVTHRRGANA
ncbi:MAG: ABC-type transporter, integral rane subunit [Amycolatopsis sp.]|jgi:ribose transport system permease protein|uniref:ABC transporter permease n=1 Tax=Amycolatopsis sp. TaxID=37632 RepID=UPI00260E13F3|nr:ABC transporter permease [Amycolatopsis sp.]MCU1686349.1 ABC-type transporter, integral rane subunit [Amycolatopsis sp.]